MLSTLQPASPLAPDVVTPTPMQAGQPLGENAIISMALDISQHYTGDPTLTDIQLTVSMGHREIPGAGPAGTAAMGAPADHPAEAGSLREAFPTALTKASAPTTALPKTAEAKEDYLTMEEEVQPHIGIRSVTFVFNHLPPLPHKGRLAVHW